jgi:hypothetical protein
MRRLFKFWLAGFVGGMLCCFWYLLNGGRISLELDSLIVLQNFTFVLWPSSLLLMSLSGQHPLNTLAITSISLFLNGFIYMGIGYFLGKVFRASAPSDDVRPGPAS